MILIKTLWVLWLLPTYVWGAVSWRIRYKKWVWVDPYRYVLFAKDWMTYYISTFVWLLVLLIIERLV